MKLTDNYKLKKPEANEYYDVKDFNSNADTIDAALGKFAAEHQVVHYKSLDAIGLTDADLRDEDGALLDAATCFWKIHVASVTPCEIRMTNLSASSNLAQIIREKLKTDVALDQSSNYNVVINRLYLQSKITVLLTYHADGMPVVCNTEYSCMIRVNQSGSLKFLTRFIPTFNPGDQIVRKETPRVILQSDSGQRAVFSSLDSNNCAAIQISATEDLATYRQLRLLHDGGAASVKDALVLRDVTSSGTKTYKLFGTHNPPSCGDLGAAAAIHAACHAAGGADPVTPAAIGAMPVRELGNGGDLDAILKSGNHRAMYSVDSTVNGAPTYEVMEEFIKGYESNEAACAAALKEYEIVKKISLTQKAAYAYVKKWFLAKYKDEFNRRKEELEAEQRTKNEARMLYVGD